MIPDIQRNEQIENRLAKLEKLKSQGINPYGQRFDRTHMLREIVDKFEELEGQVVTVAGRLVAKRGQGKVSFTNIADQTGTLQLFAKIDVLGEPAYQNYLDLDLGDIIGVTGKVFKTQRGEISVQVQSYQLLSKRFDRCPTNGTD